MEIIQKYKSKYDIGDIVIFRNDNKLEVGIVEGGYIDDTVFWFNIRINKNLVYTYSNGGDIAEFDIIGKLQGELFNTVKKIIRGEE